MKCSITYLLAALSLALALPTSSAEAKSKGSMNFNRSSMSKSLKSNFSGSGSNNVARKLSSGGVQHLSQGAKLKSNAVVGTSSPKMKLHNFNSQKLSNVHVADRVGTLNKTKLDRLPTGTVLNSSTGKGEGPIFNQNVDGINLRRKSPTIDLSKGPIFNNGNTSGKSPIFDPNKGPIFNPGGSKGPIFDPNKGPVFDPGAGKGPIVGGGKGPIFDPNKGPIFDPGKGPIVGPGSGGKGPIFDPDKGPIFDPPTGKPPVGDPGTPPPADPGNGGNPPPTDPGPGTPPTTPPTTPPCNPPCDPPYCGGGGGWYFPLPYPGWSGYPGGYGNGCYGGTTVVDTVYAPVTGTLPVETAVPAAAVDLELVDVQQLDRGDMSQGLGPAFRVTFRNATGAAVAQPFNVALAASTGRQATQDSAFAMTRVEGLQAGQSLTVDVRLPAKALMLGTNADGGAVPYSWLTAVVDTHQEVQQTSRENDYAVMNRSEIVLVAQK